MIKFTNMMWPEKHEKPLRVCTRIGEGEFWTRVPEPFEERLPQRFNFRVRIDVDYLRFDWLYAKVCLMEAAAA